MTLFNTSSPAYKTAMSPGAVAYAPVASSSGLAGFLGSLLGSSTPVYKTVDSQARQAPGQCPSSGLMRIFVGSAPSYKTVQSPADDEVGDDEMDTDDEDADDACSPPTDTVVLL